MCFPRGSPSFQKQNISNSFWVFFHRWDFLDNMCLSQSCLRDYIIPIIPLCRLSLQKNCERRTDYMNETNLYGLLARIIYVVGKSFCSHLFWMEFIVSEKKGSSTPATTQTCEWLIKRWFSLLTVETTRATARWASCATGHDVAATDDAAARGRVFLIPLDSWVGLN